MIIMSKKPDKEEAKGITVKKEDDMPEWYEQVCLKAELAEFSDVKGCMVVRPNGYQIWEAIMNFFDKNIKKIGVKNAAFPLFIPEHYFKKEQEHAEGFAPEVAWVTEAGDNKIEERLAIRPTSETIISESFKKWLRSYRDLPIRVNQWCSVVRWETQQTKLFLRSREFWWQEGHCIYETKEGCLKEVLQYLEEYRKVSEELLAIPVFAGVKTEKEKFAGAEATYAIEAFMPDGKALQMGTSHELGQGFMKAFGVQFKDKNEKMQTPWYTSWGISTRMVGAVVMVHGDNKGLVLPPRVAYNKVVIVPIFFKEKDKVLGKCKDLAKDLKQFNPILDDRDEYTPGWKFNEHELMGIPLRIEVGPKDIEKKQAVVVRRDTGKKDFIKLKELKEKIPKILDKMHDDLFDKAKKFVDDNIVEANDFDKFKKAIKDKKIVKCLFCNEEECEDWIKDKADGASSRVYAMGQKKPKGKCVHCGKDAKVEIYFSKCY